LFLEIYLVVLFLDSKGLLNLFVAFSSMKSNSFVTTAFTLSCFQRYILIDCIAWYLFVKTFIKFKVNSIAVGMPNAYDLLSSFNTDMED
jgi:hypothetical protein